MDRLELVKNYNRINKSYTKILVYHLGGDSGFFSEYNNMILAMLYCLNNKIQFKLYSDNSSFFEKGWGDFYLPFCDEISESFHKKINMRYPRPSWSEVLKTKDINVFIWKMKSCFYRLVSPYYKRKYGFNYYTYELWNEIRDRKNEDRKYVIPELGIDGDLQSACSQLIYMTWAYNQQTEKEVEGILKQIELPVNYQSCHIRGGDKFLEQTLFPVQSYIDKIRENSISVNDIFVLTDDYRIIEYIQSHYPMLHLYTLCGKEEKGYFHSNFVTTSKSNQRFALLKLFASVDVLCRSCYFIGTFSSNPGMYVGMRSPDIANGVDYEKWLIW